CYDSWLPAFGVYLPEFARPRVEQPELTAVPARRVRHGQAAKHHFVALDIDERPAAGFAGPPTARFVRFAKYRDVARSAVAQGEAVQMAPVFRNHGCDERGVPPGHKVELIAQGGQAAEAGINQPQAVRTVRDVVCVDVASPVKDLRKVERVVA